MWEKIAKENVMSSCGRCGCDKQTCLVARCTVQVFRLDIIRLLKPRFSLATRLW